jgi:hypothetical protein
MNAAEHMVESYFRLCRGCFTCADRKVLGGNNRQLDILAYNLKEKQQFHIEVSVTHQQSWFPSRRELEQEFEGKFFGAPPKRTSSTGNRTDHEKGKSYYPQIEAAYIAAGFLPAGVRRVWVCWFVKGEDNARALLWQFDSRHLKRRFEIEVLSLRDVILPDLEKEIGTANYDDEILRTLSLLKQFRSQTGK